MFVLIRMKTNAERRTPNAERRTPNAEVGSTTRELRSNVRALGCAFAPHPGPLPFGLSSGSKTGYRGRGWDYLMNRISPKFGVSAGIDSLASGLYPAGQ